MLDLGIALMERGLVPDAVLRAGIRRLCRERLQSLAPRTELDEIGHAAALASAPVAVHAREANEQHYELPPAFFEKVLGPHRKYSSCFWPGDCASLEEAERLSLEATVERAELADGQRILELGCGWGSLTLFMAARFPKARITAVSNSALQREHILARARERALANVSAVTGNVADMAALPGGPYDRVVSVEMFEHMRNYETLLARVAEALVPRGKLFLHVFAHRSRSYFFEVEGGDNWMGRYFFTGGQMPARTLLPRFQKDLRLEADWWWNGTHYGKTAEAWLENHDRRGDEVMEVLRTVYGKDAKRWNQRWRVFWMACAELFNYDGGREWGVAHHRFVKP